MNKVVIKNGNDLMKALGPGGDLFGLKENLPENFNILEAGFPQTFIVDKKNKTFTLELKADEPQPNTSKSNKDKKIYIVAGIVAAVIIAVVIGAIAG